MSGFTVSPLVMVVAAVSCLTLLGIIFLILARNSKDRDINNKFEQIDKNQMRLESAVKDEIFRTRREMGTNSQQTRQEIIATLASLTRINEDKLEKMRATVQSSLNSLQEDNNRKLDQMRLIVDEKLQTTLERRLGESFKVVNAQLKAVYEGLGEMQSLASNVGDLKNVLTNVKTRGIWGEIQLASLLEQILTPEQYSQNIATKKNSNERVEFAVKLPGPDKAKTEVVWLPIDAKFPKEDYQRLLQAQEDGALESVERFTKQLESRIKEEARDIRAKYISPPDTTDFAIMFLPIEGLYAEVLRRPGLVDFLQRQHRVVISGPTTLAALLNSLQMGFRTLAIQKRSFEIWQLLGTIKTEFGKFAGILDRTKDKLSQAAKTIEEASSKTRNIQRKLNKVEELPAEEKLSLAKDIIEESA